VKKNYRISGNELREWLEKLPECCTIATSYFPEKLSGYESYLFLFETDYEDFIPVGSLIQERSKLKNHF
jgi:hypothetical protein